MGYSHTRRCLQYRFRSDAKTAEKRYWGGDILWTTPKDLSDLEGAYLESPPRTITEEGLRSCAASLLPANSVLLSSRAPIGLVAINTVPMATNQGFKSLICNERKLDSKFLFHWLKSKTSHLQGLGNGATFKEISKSVVERIEIPLPPLDEQRRIAAILDKADALRRKRKRAIELLDGLTQSIFLEMFGDPVSNSKGWSGATVSSISSKIGSGATPNGGGAAYKPTGISLVRSMNVRDEGFLKKGLAFIDELQAAKLANVCLEAGDVLLNITGASVARVCICPADILPARVNQHVSIIRSRHRYLNEFIAAALKMPAMKEKLLGAAESGATRQAITKAQIEELWLPLPPQAMVQLFNTSIEQLSLIAGHAVTCSQRETLLFSSLQSRAFSGQL